MVGPSGTPFFHLSTLLTSLSLPYSASFLDLPCTDEETAQHLHSALPKGSEVSKEHLRTALQDFRRQHLGYEARVRQALASLGLRMAT